MDGINAKHDFEKMMTELVSEELKSIFGYSISEVSKRDKHKDISIARAVAMYVLHNIVGISCAKVGKTIGGRSRRYVQRSISATRVQVAIESDLKYRTNELVELVLSRAGLR